MEKKSFRLTTIFTTSLTLSFVLFMGVMVASGAWSEPTQPAPNGNVAAPINVSNNLQVKQGPVIISNTGNPGLSTYTGLSVPVGRVGIGTLTPEQKLDVNGQIAIRGGSPGAGKVLTSDAAGVATWETPVGGGGGITMLSNPILAVEVNHTNHPGGYPAWTTYSAPALDAYAGRTIYIRLACFQTNFRIRAVGTFSPVSAYSPSEPGANCVANQFAWAPFEILKLDSNGDFELRASLDFNQYYIGQIWLYGYW